MADRGLIRGAFSAAGGEIPGYNLQAATALTNIGIGLGAAGLGALGGMRSIDVEKAKEIETRMYKARQMLDGGISAEAQQHSAHAVSLSRESSSVMPAGSTSSANKEKRSKKKD